MRAAPTTEDHRMFEALAGSLDQLVFVTEVTGRMLWCNDAFTAQTGFAAGDFQFENPDNPFIHPDDIAGVVSRLAEFVASGATRSAPIVNRFFTKWGRANTYRSTVARGSWEGRDALCVVASCVTGSEVGSQPDPSYAKIVEGASDGILKVSSDGRFHFSNRRFQELIGATAVELAKLNLYGLTHPDDRVRVVDALRQLTEGEVPSVQFEARVLPANGDVRWFDVSASRLDDAPDRGLLLAFVRDVTDARRLEAKMREAQKLESLGVLAGGIAHDFNNLMTGVLANASMIENMTGVPATVVEVMADMRLAAERAASMSTSLLAYAGKAPKEVASLDLGAVVGETTRLVRAVVSKSVEVKLDVSERQVMVRADLAQLSQVVMNLVINAAEAAGEGRNTVTVETRVVDVQAPDRRCTWLPTEPPAGTYARLRVADTGRGLRAELVPRIFDPFFSTKTTGRGLGLSAVLGIVRSHGGAIGIESEVGAGTTFDVLLPLSDTLPRSKSPTAPRRAAGPRPGRVLVVDDEALIRDLERRILALEGYEVECAASGDEALAACSADPQRFDAVVVDHSMPGMHGDALLFRLKALNAKLAFVHASGYRDDALRAGLPVGTVMLDKPFSASELLTAVRNALRFGAGVEPRTESLASLEPLR
jgi:two-component system cell cycle sensor histidine kinase/response regulator CckA